MQQQMTNDVLQMIYIEMCLSQKQLFVKKNLMKVVAFISMWKSIYKKFYKTIYTDITKSFMNDFLWSNFPSHSIQCDHF